MDLHGRDTFSEAECFAILDRLFPDGFAGADVLRELAPQGWQNSPLLRVFHPTVEQVHREHLVIHRNLESLRRPDDNRPPAPEPTIEETRRDHRDKPIEPAREAGELVALCLWDLFSDNHDVLAPDGRVVNLGSFRGAAGFLADLFNHRAGDSRYDYMDFYMGTFQVGGRADLTPVYAMIFRRLQALGLDWEYSFPRLHALDLRPLQKALAKEERGDPEWAGYSPADAFAQETAEAERERRLEEIREKLDEGHREAVEESRKHPPPETVQAYHAVYGRYPRGWPPWEE